MAASCALVGAALFGLATGMRAQSLTYASGQTVSPAFEGWEMAADGSASFLFGYMNENWEEELDLPVGPDNTFEAAGDDLGQPTHFLPGRNRFVFKVPVPKDFGAKELVWTLRSRGVTQRAYASLRQEYFVDDVTIASETGALGFGFSDPTMRSNKPPTVTIEGDSTRRVKPGEPLRLVALVTDDGIPQTNQESVSTPALAVSIFEPPIRLTVEKALGLHVSWFVYRGSGTVTFDPLQVKPWEDTRIGANSPWAAFWRAPALPPDHRWVAEATFMTPGTYVLRARADDGGLLTDAEVTVTVAPDR